jgi:hypothetical protein
MVVMAAEAPQVVDLGAAVVLEPGTMWSISRNPLRGQLDSEHLFAYGHGSARTPDPRTHRESAALRRHAAERRTGPGPG